MNTTEQKQAGEAAHRAYIYPVEVTSFKEGDFGVCDGNGGDLICAHLQKSEAETIAAIINSHAALVAALEEVAGMKWVATTEEAMRGGNTPACAAEAMHNIARAALAQAKEGQP